MSNWWSNYPWRVIQPNFREIDTINFSYEDFLRELEEFSCDAVMLNAAGLMASYHSDLEDHVDSKYISDFDLKKLVDMCHEKNIKVIARTDFSKIPQEVFERHPDWAYRHSDGTELNYNGYVQTCLIGGYQREYMDEILKEMFSKIPFDGIYCNMGSATGYIVDYSMNRHGPCQCDNCKKAFKDKYGLDIPEELRPGDKASMMYFGFQQEMAGAQKKRITTLLKSINPELAYCSIDYSRQEANKDYGCELPHWQYQASSAARAMRGMDVEATVANVDFMGFPYRHISSSVALQELRLWQTLSNFSGIDYYVMGRLYDKEDKSSYDSVKKIFKYAKDNEKYLEGVNSEADILLVRDSYVIPNKEERGWVRILTESHYLFDETLMQGIAKKDLSKYKAVILPSKNRLNDTLQKIINKYVESGGTIITSGEMVALESAGINEVGKMQKGLEGALFELSEEERELFTSFKERKFIIVGEDYLENKYNDAVTKYGVFNEPERFGPPELCYKTEESKPLPAVTCFAYGSGKGLTIPWHIGTNYYTDGHDSFRLLVKDILDKLCDIKTIEDNTSPMVEVSYGKKDDFEVIHFVNNSGHFGNSYFEPAPLYKQSIALPWNGGEIEYESLGQGDEIECNIQDGKIYITVNVLKAHACVIVRKR